MKGIGVSPGIAIGRAWVLRPKQTRGSGLLLADETAVERETALYRVCVEKAAASLEAMIARAGEQEAEILGIQVELLRDPQLEEDVLDRISSRQPARDAVIAVIERLVQAFTQMEDEYMRARAADIQDIGNRILRTMDGANEIALPEGEGWIVVAEDLSPSETVGLDSRVSGFVTQAGGATSHAAIVARLRGLPAVVGCGKTLGVVVNGDLLVLDGADGAVSVNPDAAEIED